MTNVTRRALMALGVVLRTAREDRGLRQVDVAAVLSHKGVKCSQTYVVQIEAGKMADPTVRLLKALAELYHLRYEDLVLTLVKEKYGVELLVRKKR